MANIHTGVHLEESERLTGGSDNGLYIRFGRSLTVWFKPEHLQELRDTIDEIDLPQE